MNPNNQPTQPVQPTPPPVDPPVAPAPGQKVQYVITQQSLNGLSGWLLFFLIIFALVGIGYISIFFNSMSDINKPDSTVQLLFAPLLAIGYLGTATLIALRKKIAIILAYITYAITALNIIALTFVSPEDDYTLATQVTAAVTAIVIYALLALYFKQSRRVKETLVK